MLLMISNDKDVVGFTLMLLEGIVEVVSILVVISVAICGHQRE